MKEIKRCKPINQKTKGFDSCGQMVPAGDRTFGICKKCLGEWMFSTEEGKKYFELVRERARKKVEEENRKKEREQKLANSDYKSKLQDRVNEIARLIDIGLPCLARGYHASQMHGGHIFSRGSETAMRFNLHNIHRQSAQSNHIQNEDGLLREKLCEEYGDEYYEFLNSMRQIPALKYTNAEYREFYKTANAMANELKRRGRRFNARERIVMRNVINKGLGIYPEEYCAYAE